MMAEPVWQLAEDEEAEPETVAHAVASQRVGEKRRALDKLTRLEFLTDLVRCSLLPLMLASCCLSPTSRSTS